MKRIKDFILVVCAIAAVVLNFWTAAKPVETKLVIIRWLIDLSCMGAIMGAAYFLMMSEKPRLSSACAFYNFLVQSTLFGMSPLPIARLEILTIVGAAIFFSIIIVFGLASMLLNAQVQLQKVQTDMMNLHTKIVSILQGIPGIPPTQPLASASIAPPPSPSP